MSVEASQGIEPATSSDDLTVPESVHVQQHNTRAQDWAFFNGAEVLPEGRTAIVEYFYADTE